MLKREELVHLYLDRLVIKHWKSYEAVLLCHKLPHLVVMGAEGDTPRNLRVKKLTLEWSRVGSG